jgi:23S rRNA-/tRNA-specific pseudouridylate synthase
VSTSAPPEDFWDTLPLHEGVRLLAKDANGLAAFDKPAGVLSHPNGSEDEARALLTCRYDKDTQCFIWKRTDGSTRQLWLLNRLDSATSGVILTASSEKLAVVIRAHFTHKLVRKAYNALVFGHPHTKKEIWRDLLAINKKSGLIRAATVGNIPSETHFEAIKHAQKNFSTTLIRLEPRTGRSHQLRVQCAKRHLPIIGDQTYGDFGLNREFAKANKTKRLFLHSLETAFTYEFGGKPFAFKAGAPLPPEFAVTY